MYFTITIFMVGSHVTPGGLRRPNTCGGLLRVKWPLKREEVMLNPVPSSVGLGIKRHSNYFKYQYVFQHILLGVSDKKWGKQKSIVTRDTKLL
jgi:hypothetical protein